MNKLTMRLRFLTNERIKWLNWATQKGNENKCSVTAGLHIVSALAEAMEIEKEILEKELEGNVKPVGFTNSSQARNGVKK